MNILVLCTSPDLGGLELYAAREIEKLAEYGNSCHAAVKKGSRLVTRITGMCPVTYVSQAIIHLFPLINAWRLSRYIDSNDIDIIHIHWGKDLNLAALTKKLAKQNVKLVYSRHMQITREKKDPYHRYFYSQLDKLLVITKRLFEEAYKYLPLKCEDIEVLYLGVRAPNGKTQECLPLYPESAKTNNSLKVAVFGRIEYGKGQHIIIAAIEELVRQKVDISLTLVGHVMNETYAQELLEKIRSSKVDLKVKMVGFVDEPMSSMPCFDVVVLTTFCETFGLVLVEAMRTGVTVIGTNAGGVPEIIDDKVSGLLVKPGDSHDLAKALKLLNDDRRLLKRLAENGKQKADAIFSEDRHFDQLNKTLLSLNNQQA